MKARENPFRRERLESLAYRAPDFDWDLLEARLKALGGRGAIIGPKGHGKTTLMEQLAARHPGAVYFRIREGQRRLDTAQRSFLQTESIPWILVDSAEQLSWFGWWELRRRVPRDAQFIITAHRPGRLPTLFRCATSPDLLGELIVELTGQPMDPRPLWQRHRGNVRNALRELYDSAANPLPKSAHSA